MMVRRGLLMPSCLSCSKRSGVSSDHSHDGVVASCGRTNEVQRGIAKVAFHSILVTRGKRCRASKSSAMINYLPLGGGQLSTLFLIEGLRSRRHGQDFMGSYRVCSPAISKKMGLTMSCKAAASPIREQRRRAPSHVNETMAQKISAAQWVAASEAKHAFQWTTEKQPLD